MRLKQLLRLKPLYLLLFAGSIVSAFASYWIWEQYVSSRELGFFSVSLPQVTDGLATDHYVVESRSFKENEFLGSLLSDIGVPGRQQHEVAVACQEVFNLRTIRPGQTFHVFRDPGNCTPNWLIYEPGPYRVFKIKLTGQPTVTRIDRPVEVVTKSKSGEIRSSLWNAMTDADLPIPLIIGMEAALECAVDFHHLQKGDHFKLIYDEDHLHGERIGLGRIHAVSFHQGDSTYHAIYFEKDTIKGYYDIQGRPMKSMFLKAPVRFSRISSYFSSSRLHPILKIRRPHLGTDYAAPYGTEILSVADGTVTQATRGGGNGIFVRVRHNGTYETQYLHMQRIAKGIKPGTRVRQGQVIGYVGSTGLATGPHVCFRFWKNGRQVNPARERFPEAKPMPKHLLPDFFAHRDSLVQSLRTIPKVKESLNPGSASKPAVVP